MTKKNRRPTPSYEECLRKTMPGWVQITRKKLYPTLSNDPLGIGDNPTLSDDPVGIEGP